MATLEDMIQEVLLNLEGFSGDQELYGTLLNPITNSATTLTIASSAWPDGSGFTAGAIEVGEELIYAQSFDRATGIFTGCLRGWRGASAVAHITGELVRNNPRYPRVAIRRAINDTIQALHPRVPSIKTATINANGGTVRYALPTDVFNVMRVTVEVPGATKTWEDSKRWKFVPTAPGASTNTIDIWDAFPGRQVQVVYQAKPTDLVSLTDTLTTAGFEEWLRDVIIYGACYRLAAFADAGRLTSTSVEQAAMNAAGAGIPASAGQNLSKYFYGLYSARLSEAEARIQDAYPVSRHYTR